MKKILVVVFMIGFFVSCGIQRHAKKYSGQNIAVAIKQFGNPKTIVEKGTSKIYIFEVSKLLRGTEISQGKATLDPMYSPSVNKIERYTFTTADGVIIDTNYETEYNR